MVANRSAAKSGLVYEHEIRAALSAWLRLEHQNEHFSLINELSIPRPASRIDVAMVNGRFSGFEIKSDADSLSRLSTQLPSYDAVFEEVTLVTTTRHIKVARDLIPGRWGIVLYEPTIGMKAVRRPKARLPKRVDYLLHILTSQELLRVALLLSDSTKKSISKCERIHQLQTGFRRSDLTYAVRVILKSRSSAIR